MTRLHSPCHPGTFINNEIMKPLNLSVLEAADKLGIETLALSKTLLGKAALSPALARQIERMFGISAATLLRMQDAYNASRTKASVS